jgi:hypothetical protein
MHTDGKEDGRSIEDILASIRRLITDASDATGAVSPVPPSFASLAEALDRDGGFEVPAMFRAPYSGDSGRSAPAPGYEPLDEMRAEGASAFPEPSTDANRPQAEQPNASAPEPWFDALSAAARTLESMQSGAGLGRDGARPATARAFAAAGRSTQRAAHHGPLHRHGDRPDGTGTKTAGSVSAFACRARNAAALGRSIADDEQCCGKGK